MRLSEIDGNTVLRILRARTARWGDNGNRDVALGAAAATIASLISKDPAERRIAKKLLLEDATNPLRSGRAQ